MAPKKAAVADVKTEAKKPVETKAVAEKTVVEKAVAEKAPLLPCVPARWRHCVSQAISGVLSGLTMLSWASAPAVALPSQLVKPLSYHPSTFKASWTVGAHLYPAQ